MCVLCISNPLVDWHAFDLSSIGPAQAGTGEGGSSNGTSVSFNPALVNQLDSGWFWENSGGTVAQTISYGFTTSGTFASGFGEASGWSAFTAAQKTAVRQMMTLWDDLIAPSFVESTGSPNTADIKFSNSTTDVSYAHAYFPGQVNDEASSYDKIEGSVWLNPAYNNGTNNLVTPTPGIYGYMAILHEIGHSLGLDHGGNYNGGSPQYGNTSTGWLYTEDSHQYTIMSYFNANNTGANWGSKFAQTPMVYDVMAIQQMYGADYTARAGDTIYGFNSNAGNSLYNFSQNTSPILTIWDGDGIDTIDLSGWSTASTITLTAGSYSNVNGMTKNLAIAYDVDIENAKGSAGNDTITGNDLGNVLIGNGGADTINGAGGNDTINGGTGVDILIGGTGDDTIYFDSLDNLTLLDGGVGFDTLIQLGVLITFDFAGHNFERLLNIITDVGAAVWSEQTDYYDFAGLYYECDITYDNGTRSVTEYDVYNTESWSEWTVTYDANGNFISEVFVPDGGSSNAPTITSNGAGSTAAVNVVENSTAVTTVTATDPDAGTVLSYSIIGGADAARFTINATTGVLSFVSAPDFEAPIDVGTNNVYNVQVRVSNGALTDTQTIVVTVTDVDEPTIINGTSSSNVLTGTAGLNIINGLAGNDTLAGLGGADTLIGGTGTDTATYIASLGGVNGSLMTGLGNGGDAEGDTLATIENLTGSNLDDTLEGNGGNNILAGGLGIDTVSYANALAGVTVNLALTSAQNTIGAGTDTLTGFENLTGSNFNDTLTGNTGNNVLRGLAGNDTLNGGVGADTMFGGTGNDTYVVDNIADIVDETGGDGTDTIQTSLAFSLAALGQIENLTLTGTGAINGTGNDLNNILTGNAGANILTGLGGNDTLNGGAGADTMFGGTGDDIYVIDNAGDVADETGGDGTDTIQSSLTFSLSDALHAKGTVENLTLTGTGAINGTGNALANVITGNTGNNILAGLGGADTLIGGTGTDTATYIASLGGVNVSLMTGLGNGGDAEGDTLATIENLTGSNLDDTLEGNGGNNILAGGLGIDTVSYANALAGVTVNLALTSAQNTIGAGTDTLTGFENLTGSNFNDTLTGNTGNNVLRGLAGNDTLNGGVGADTMFGGTGNDTYVVDNIADIVDETGGDGTDTIQTSLAFSLAALGQIENLTLTGTGAINGTGNDLNNILTGNAGANILTGLGGNDTLNGGAGADTMFGGTGDDIYVIDNAGDVADETGGDGTDTIQSSLTFSLSDALHAKGTVENLTLTGTGAINGTGNALANVITGNTGNNILAGLGGADTLIGGTGTDTATYIASLGGVNVSLMTGLGNGGDAEGDTLATIENLTGSNLDDTLEGNGGNNILAGGLGIDTVSYANALAGVTVNLALTSAQNTIGAGTDTLTGFENLTGSNFNDTLTGNTGNNVLRGLAGNDTLNGGVGADTMFGGTGNDTYVVDNIADIVDETGGDGTDTIQTSLAFSLAALGQIENLTLTGTGAINGTGNDLNNILTGNAGANILTGLGGNDTLNGGAGADTMFGGTGDDIYVIDNAGDVADETGGDGTDTIQSSLTFSLSDALHAKGTVENLTLTGTGAINGTGNALANVITGNTGNNILAGLGGADTLIGGTGTDTATYIASLGGVNVSLMTGLGNGGDAEGDTLATIENLTGSNLDDTLEGNGGNNILAGGLGIDTVSYANALAGVTVNLALTSAQNTIGAGTDTLTGFENLTGSNFNDTLTGNTGNNVLRGLAGNDTLNGGVGADTMFGGTGNDTYVVDNIADIVDETGGDGTDTIQTSLAFSLAALGQIENLTLTGTGAINGTGNDLNNILTGNAGANILTGLGGNDTLNGGAGADTMFGGTGDDIYVIDNAGDVADETGGDGTDTIQSSLTFSLSDALHAKGTVENLTLTGTGAINGTGNALANVITGNTGNNILAGLGGADTLIGGTGTDTATYIASLGGVNVSLMTGLGNGGDAEGDTLATIENLTGSNLDDTLEGNGGNNILAGGLGIDTVSYANALAGVTVNLALTSAQNTIGAGTDTLTGFENLTGSNFNDTLTGNTGNNVLRGLAGNDILAGGVGADTFDFSSLTEGSDVITDFVTGVDDIDLIDLLDSAGLGSLDYATLIAQGNLIIQTGTFITGTATNSAATLNTRFYIDADGFGAGGSVLIATLEDTLTNAGDFLV